MVTKKKRNVSKSKEERTLVNLVAENQVKEESTKEVQVEEQVMASAIALQIESQLNEQTPIVQSSSCTEKLSAKQDAWFGQTIIDAWNQQLEAAYSIQQFLENWTLDMVDQQKQALEKAYEQSQQQVTQLSNSLTPLFQSTPLFLTKTMASSDINWIKATYEPVESTVQAWVAQNQLVRDEFQGLVGKSMEQWKQAQALFLNR